jgi:hypothetical protein
VTLADVTKVSQESDSPAIILRSIWGSDRACTRLLWASGLFLMAAGPHTPPCVAFVIGTSVVANIFLYLGIGLLVCVAASWAKMPLIGSRTMGVVGTTLSTCHAQHIVPLWDMGVQNLRHNRPRTAVCINLYVTRISNPYSWG